MVQDRLVGKIVQWGNQHGIITSALLSPEEKYNSLDRGYYRAQMFNGDFIVLWEEHRGKLWKILE